MHQLSDSVRTHLLHNAHPTEHHLAADAHPVTRTTSTRTMIRRRRRRSACSPCPRSTSTSTRSAPARGCWLRSTESIRMRRGWRSCALLAYSREMGFLNERQQRLASAEWAGDGRTSGAVRRVDARPKRHDVDNGQGALSVLQVIFYVAYLPRSTAAATSFGTMVGSTHSSIGGAADDACREHAEDVRARPDARRGPHLPPIRQQ